MSVLRPAETRLFKQLLRAAQLIEVSETDNDDGEIPIPDEDNTQAVKLASFPISSEIIQRFDSGYFVKEDRMFKSAVAVGSPVAKKKDIIIFGGFRYQIDAINDRLFDGGYIDYITKREPASVSV